MGSEGGRSPGSLGGSSAVVAALSGAGTQEERLKTMLRGDKVRLWEKPYTKEDLSPGELPAELVEQYAKRLGEDGERTRALLCHLRNAAVDRLRAKRLFREKGTARLYLKFPAKADPAKAPAATPPHVDTQLTWTLRQLKEELAKPTGWDSDTLRLVSGGRVLEGERESLEKIGLQPCSELMVLREEEGVAERRWRDEVDRAKNAALRLVTGDGARSLEIQDQSGRKLDLPLEERKSLAVAMSLSELARRPLREKKWSRALLILLEADQEFQACRSEFLESVDNYALLQLDIAWCYLQLQSMRHLTDAAARLDKCDASFKKSYGPELERVRKLKESVDLERGLLLRLRLLQGVLAYHQGREPEARRRFQEVSRWLGEMVVPQDKIQALLEMGYEERESRLALRVSKGSVEGAIQRIQQRREEAEKRQKEEEERSKDMALTKLLGNCANGQPIPAKPYRQLIDMGYPDVLVLASLRDANGDLNAAVEAMARMRRDPALLQAAAAAGVAMKAAAAAAAPRPRERSRGRSGSRSRSGSRERRDGQQSGERRRRLGSKERLDQAAVEELEGAEVGEAEGEDHLDLDFNDETLLLAKYTSLLTAPKK